MYADMDLIWICMGLSIHDFDMNAKKKDSTEEEVVMVELSQLTKTLIPFFFFLT